MVWTTAWRINLDHLDHKDLVSSSLPVRWDQLLQRRNWDRAGKEPTQTERDLCCLRQRNRCVLIWSQLSLCELLLMKHWTVLSFLVYRSWRHWGFVSHLWPWRAWGRRWWAPSCCPTPHSGLPVPSDPGGGGAGQEERWEWAQDGVRGGGGASASGCPSGHYPGKAAQCRQPRPTTDIWRITTKRESSR